MALSRTLNFTRQMTSHTATRIQSPSMAVRMPEANPRSVFIGLRPVRLPRCPIPCSARDGADGRYAGEMPSPDFVVQLREKIGHAPLWLPGVRGVVLDADGRVLLGRRSDTGQWALITGILDPGEEPGPGLLREILEETGVRARLEHLLGVSTTGPVTFPNGDVCDFLTIDFRCRFVSGTARVNDDESTDVRWFAIEALPPLRAGHREAIIRALAFDGVPDFKR